MSTNNFIDGRDYSCCNINKYQKLAICFVDRYPFTRFMDQSHLDYSTACVRNGTDINVCLIGFGKVNQQIFLTTVATNQFITKGKNGVQHKPVNYHIFDKNAPQVAKNLENTYYRFRNECSNVDEKDYLPLPDMPANEKFWHMDVNSGEFRDAVREVITRSDKDVNFAVVSLGSDMENIIAARKLIEMRNEWDVKNFVIFVHVTSCYKVGHLIIAPDFFMFHDNIDDFGIQQLIAMSIRRNYIYALQYQIAAGKEFDSYLLSQVMNQAKIDWGEKNQILRESSLYGCLSLRSKLNMIGLSWCEMFINRQAPLSVEEYFKRYAVNTSIDCIVNGNISDKMIIKYGLDFPESLRKNLAILEHYRWNAFMISKGIIPATRAQIEHETTLVDGKMKFTNGKSYELRRHGNLTTFEGLVEYRRIVAGRDNVDELDRDVIKYDYQIMDNAHWLLTECGFKIVEL